MRELWTGGKEREHKAQVYSVVFASQAVITRFIH